MRRSCDTCHYSGYPGNGYPCQSCVSLSHWVPGEDRPIREGLVSVAENGVREYVLQCEDYPSTLAIIRVSVWPSHLDVRITYADGHIEETSLSAPWAVTWIEPPC